jgi:hypothetical protein
MKELPFAGKKHSDRNSSRQGPQNEMANRCHPAPVYFFRSARAAGGESYNDRPRTFADFQ